MANFIKLKKFLTLFYNSDLLKEEFVLNLNITNSWFQNISNLILPKNVIKLRMLV